MIINFAKKHVSSYDQHFTCWWPSTIRCQDICRHSVWYADHGLLTFGREAHQSDCYKQINSISPWRCDCVFKCLPYKCNYMVDILNISSGITLRWMSQDHIDVKSTLDPVKAWSWQATSPYLNQCWQGSIMPYGATRPQRVKPLSTHWGRVTHICVSNLCQHWFRKWLVA